MIKKIIAITLLGLSFSGQAQQIPMFNQFHIAPRVYNPSYAGFNEGVNIVLLRNQKWANYGEGFITNYLSASHLLKKKHGLGINLYNDHLGITSKLKAHFLYSYHIQMGEKIFLRMGVGLGVVDNRIDFANAVVTNPNDPVLANTGRARRTMFDMNVGINFEASGFRVGVSVPQVLGSKLVYGDLNESFYTLERQYLMNMGYTWKLGQNSDIFLRPEALAMYTEGAPFQYNAGLFFEMEKYFWIGGMYKSDYAVGVNVGINLIKNLKIGLAYDFQISSIASFNSAANAELLFRYNIPPKVEKIQDDRMLDSLMAHNQAEIDSLKKIISAQRDDLIDRNNTIEVLEESQEKLAKNDGTGDNSSSEGTSGENSSSGGTSGENSSSGGTSGENSSSGGTSGENSSSGGTSGENSSSGGTSGENSSSGGTSGENSSSGGTSGENSSSGGTSGENSSSGGTSGENSSSGGTSGENSSSGGTSGENSSSGGTSGENSSSGGTSGDNSSSGGTSGDNSSSGGNTANFRTNSKDYFIELSGTDTPNGYYVIGGAFAEKKNADALIRKIKSKFPSARIIKNKRNDLYYVMLYYSTKKGEGLAYASYKANQLPDEETWVLYYNR